VGRAIRWRRDEVIIAKFGNVRGEMAASSASTGGRDDAQVSALGKFESWQGA